MERSVSLPVDLDVSEAVRLTLYQHDYELAIPEGQEDNGAYVYARQGCCMLCGNELREETLVIVSPLGLTGIWCDGECATDMTVIGWLHEILQEMTAKYMPEEEDSEAD